MYQEGSRTRFGIISLLKKRSSLLKPLKSEKEPFFTALFHFLHIFLFLVRLQQPYLPLYFLYNRNKCLVVLSGRVGQLPVIVKFPADIRTADIAPH